MSWNAVTAADVLSEFNESEQTLLEDVQADTSTLAAIVLRTINQARGAVLAGGGRVSATTGTIADQLAPDVIAIARWRWIVSVPKADTMQSAERKDLHDKAEARLDMVAKGEIRVEDPLTPSESSSASPSFETKRPKFDECGQDGL